MKRYYGIVLWVLLYFLCSCPSIADDVVTNFSPLKYIESPDFDEKAALYRVKMTPFLTYVTIEVVPTKNKTRQSYWTGCDTYVVSGNIKLPLLGAEGPNNTYHSCDHDDGWGWDNVKQGQKLYYTLIFSGRLQKVLQNSAQVHFSVDAYLYLLRNKVFCFLFDKMIDGVCPQVIETIRRLDI